jgi:hypothetical protein
MAAYGFSPTLIHFFQHYLKDRCLEVVVGGATSRPRKLEAGIPQGSALSATLFLIYINDLLMIPKNQPLAYADDITLCNETIYKGAPRTKQRIFDQIELDRSLQTDLDRVTEWGNQNAVKFNQQKTKMMMINLLRTPIDVEINMNGTTLSLEEHLEILGISISENLSWRDHLLNLVAAAARKLGALVRVAKYFTSSQLLTIYKSNIRPSIEYCSHVWGGSSSVWVLERIDRRARRLIGAPEDEMNLQTLQQRRDIADLTILYKIYHHKCSTELHELLPPDRIRCRHTRAEAEEHRFLLENITARTERFKQSYLPRTIIKWNTLPERVFPIEYDPVKFKKNISVSICT